MSSFLPTSPAERYFLVNARDKAKCALRCRLFDVEDASTIFIMKSRRSDGMKLQNFINVCISCHEEKKRKICCEISKENW
jgi:hypothetical protein